MIDQFLMGLLRANLAGAVAILLVLALRKPVRRMFGARLAYALWLVVPAAAAASLLPQPTTATLLSPIVVTAGAVVGRTMPQALGAGHTTNALGILWLAGALAATAILVRRQGQFMASLGRLEPMARGSKVFCAEHAGVGPAVVGAWRPKIVTPADFETRFGAEERKVILAHERVHLETGDARINALAAAAQCLAWFNPLVHVGVYRLRIDQELACDAAVLARFPAARRLYAEALLKVQLASQALPVGCHWPAAAEHPLRERIVMLKSRPPTPSRKATGLVLVAALSLGGACAAWAANPANPDKPAKPIVTQPRWLEHPGLEEVRRYYPIEALRLGVAGGAVIDCRVDATGRLENCVVLSEYPAKYGFGEAALQLSNHFQMGLTIRDGIPTHGAQVSIPLRFAIPKAQPQAD